MSSITFVFQPVSLPIQLPKVINEIPGRNIRKLRDLINFHVVYAGNYFLLTLAGPRPSAKGDYGNYNGYTGYTYAKRFVAVAMVFVSFRGCLNLLAVFLLLCSKVCTRLENWNRKRNWNWRQLATEVVWHALNFWLICKLLIFIYFADISDCGSSLSLSRSVTYFSYTIFAKCSNKHVVCRC